MARKDPRPDVSRRKFLAGVAVAGAASDRHATARKPRPRRRCEQAAAFGARCRPRHQIAVETGDLREPTTQIQGRPDSDFMVDVIKSLKIDYCLLQSGIELPRPARVADQLRQEHDAGVHHLHARGIVGGDGATATSRPRASRRWCCCHGTVGLQHAAMAIYNAWCDRVPVIVVGGNDLDAAHRPPGVPTVPLGAGHQRAGARLHQVGRHAGVAAALRAVVRARLQVRDDAALRAGDDLARRRPAGAPIEERANLYIPRYVPTAPPHADLNALRETAKLLVNARASGDRRRQDGAHRRRA